jgi:hypothetical protein
MLLALLITLGGSPAFAQTNPVIPAAVCNNPAAGAANKTAFVNALATGAAVYVPACPSNGCFYVDRFTIPANRTMFGDSRQTSCISGTGVFNGNEFITLSSGVTIRNMRILTPLGIGPSFAGFDLQGMGVSDVEISNVELTGEVCLKLTNSQDVIADRVNCSQHHTYGFWGITSQRISMTRWTMANASDYQHTGYGIYCSVCNGFRVEDSWIGYNTVWGIYADSYDAGPQGSDVIIRGNRIYTWSAEAFGVRNVNGAIMTDNIVYTSPQHADNCASSSSGTANLPTQGLIFANNKMEGCGASGILLAAYTAYSAVTGNVVINNSSHGVNQGNCIANDQSSRNVVVGNNCSNNLGSTTYSITESSTAPGGGWNLYGGNGGIPGSSYYGPLQSTSTKLCGGVFC